MVEGLAVTQQVLGFEAHNSITPAWWYTPGISHSEVKEVEARDSAGTGKDTIYDNRLKLVNKYLKINQKTRRGQEEVLPCPARSDCCDPKRQPWQGLNEGNGLL